MINSRGIYQSPLQRYLEANEDVSAYIKKIKEVGPQQDSNYNEKAWLDLTNKRLGTSFADTSDFRDEDLAKTHYENWGKNESRDAEIKKAIAEDLFTQTEHDTIRKRYLDAEYTPKQDLSQFEALLGKLEGSKMKQADQANRARRGNIYSQGIAQMMRNF
jgi:hypothetical protein